MRVRSMFSSLKKPFSIARKIGACSEPYTQSRRSETLSAARAALAAATRPTAVAPTNCTHLLKIFMAVHPVIAGGVESCAALHRGLNAFILVFARNQKALEEHDRKEQQDPEHAHADDGGEHQFGVERDVGGVDDVAEPLAGGDELADHGADDRQRDRYFQRREEIRHRPGKADFGN